MNREREFERKLSDDGLRIATCLKDILKISKDNWTPSMSKGQLDAVLDKGASLNVYLRPSAVIEDRKGSLTYIENYKLPFIVAEEDLYIAMTSGYDIDVTTLFSGGRNYYAYSNCGGGFFSFIMTPGNKKLEELTRYMSLARYEELEWIVTDTHDLIFEGKEFQESEAVLRAIREGRNLRVTIDLDDGRRVRQDVDLFFYYPDSKNTYGYTQTTYVPEFFNSPKALNQLCMKHLYDPVAGYKAEMNFKLPDNGTVLPIAYSFYGDGRLQNAFDIALNRFTEFKHIRIFAEKESPKIW